RALRRLTRGLENFSLNIVQPAMIATAKPAILVLNEFQRGAAVSTAKAHHPRDDRVPTRCRGAHSARPEPRTVPLRRGTTPRLRLGSFGATAFRAARRQTRSGANNAAASRLPRFRARPESTFHFLPC